MAEHVCICVCVCVYIVEPGGHGKSSRFIQGYTVPIQKLYNMCYMDSRLAPN
jgi:hypothetical protein